MVAGYDAVRETGDVSLLQVTAEDDSTLVVVLNGKFDWFLTEVCTAPATMPLRQDLLQEETAAADGETAEAAAEAAEAAPWWNDLTGLVTNGPYQVSGYEAGEALTLEASETYRNSFSGPQTLTFRFAETAEAGQDLYDAGEVDFLGILPAEPADGLDRGGEPDPGAGAERSGGGVQLRAGYADGCPGPSGADSDGGPFCRC